MKLLVINLDTFQLVQRLDLGFQNNNTSVPLIPALPIAFAVNGPNLADFVVSMSEGDLSAYAAGVQLPSQLLSRFPFSSVHISNDGERGVAVESTEANTFIVNSTGVTETGTIGTVLAGHPSLRTPLPRAGDELFSLAGDIYDLQTGSITNPCNRTVANLAAGAAIPLSSGTRVLYYLTTQDQDGYVTCDRATGVTESLSKPQTFGGVFLEVLAAFETVNDRVVLVSNKNALIVDSPQ